MNVSSVKNLNGEVFSAVQDASLTNVVQTNSGNWQDITAYQSNSASYLTAHQDLSDYYTKSQTSGAEELAQAFSNIPLGDEAVNSAVHELSGTWNEVSSKLDTTAFSDVSGTFLTAHQAISAEEWNSNYETVNTNSGAWGGDALPISAGPGIKLETVDNTLVARTDETVLFSGDISNYTALSGSITASENLKNFESIRIDYTMEQTNPGWAPIETRQFSMNLYGIADNSFYLNLNSLFAVTNDMCVERFSKATINDNVLTINFDCQRVNAGTLSTLTGMCHILGITGINRK